MAESLSRVADDVAALDCEIGVAQAFDLADVRREQILSRRDFAHRHIHHEAFWSVVDRTFEVLDELDDRAVYLNREAARLLRLSAAREPDPEVILKLADEVEAGEVISYAVPIGGSRAA